jgi:hypothetical protein
MPFKDLPEGETHHMNDGHNHTLSNSENDFYEILPVIKSNLTLDEKVARIKIIFEKLLIEAKNKFYNDGFYNGKAEMYETVRELIQKQRKEQYDLGYKHAQEKAKAELLKIADEGEYEDLRREIISYFK